MGGLICITTDSPEDYLLHGVEVENVIFSEIDGYFNNRIIAIIDKDGKAYSIMFELDENDYSNICLNNIAESGIENKKIIDLNYEIILTDEGKVYEMTVDRQDKNLKATEINIPKKVIKIDKTENIDCNFFYLEDGTVMVTIPIPM